MEFARIYYSISREIWKAHSAMTLGWLCLAGVIFGLYKANWLLVGACPAIGVLLYRWGFSRGKWVLNDLLTIAKALDSSRIDLERKALHVETRDLADVEKTKVKCDALLAAATRQREEATAKHVSFLSGETQKAKEQADAILAAASRQREEAEKKHLARLGDLEAKSIERIRKHEADVLWKLRAWERTASNKLENYFDSLKKHNGAELDPTRASEVVDPAPGFRRSRAKKPKS